MQLFAKIGLGITKSQRTTKKKLLEILAEVLADEMKSFLIDWIFFQNSEIFLKEGVC